MSDLVHVLCQEVVHFPHVGTQELLLRSRRLLHLVASGRQDMTDMKHNVFVIVAGIETGQGVGRRSPSDGKQLHQLQPN